MKKLLLTIAVAAPLLAGCAPGNPPCEQLPPPSEAEQTATREGAEVEREVSGNYSDAECVVVGDRWVDQTDDK